MSRLHEPGDAPQRPNFTFPQIAWGDFWQRIKYLGLALGGILGIFLVYSMFYRIEASDEGVVLRFGRRLTTVPQNGGPLPRPPFWASIDNRSSRFAFQMALSD